MRTPGRMLTVCAVATLAALSSGCVSKEQYDKLNAMYRKCNEHREQLQQELQAQKDENAALNGQLAGMRDQLSGKDSQIAKLQEENATLSAALEKLRGVAQAPVTPPDPKVIVKEVKLPAELDKALREFAEKYPGIVDYDRKRGAVKWKSDLLFALGSDVVKDSAKSSLAAFAKIAASTAAKQFDVIVVGHTDNVPIAKAETRQKHPTNWHLSAHRAISVNFLMMEYGVPKTRTGIMGYGEYRPIAPNTTAEGRQKNRRVEIYLVNRASLGVGQDDGITWLKDGSLAFARVR